MKLDGVEHGMIGTVSILSYKCTQHFILLHSAKLYYVGRPDMAYFWLSNARLGAVIK